MSNFSKEKDQRTKNPFRIEPNDPIQSNELFQELKKQYENQLIPGKLRYDQLKKKKSELTNLEAKLKRKIELKNSNVDCKSFMSELQSLLRKVEPKNKKKGEIVDPKNLKYPKNKFDRVIGSLSRQKEEKIKSRREMKRKIQDLETTKYELTADIQNLEFNVVEMETRHLEKETKKEELYEIKSKVVQLLQLLNTPTTMDSVFENLRNICNGMSSSTYSNIKMGIADRSKAISNKLAKL